MNSTIDENTNLSLLSFYDQKEKNFIYHSDVLKYFGDDLNNYNLWDFLLNNNLINSIEAKEIKTICETITDGMQTKSYVLNKRGLHCFTFIANQQNITIVIRNLEEKNNIFGVTEYDELTSLLNRSAFVRRISKTITANLDQKYAVCFFDIVKFKAINVKFSYAEGNKVLIHLGNILKSNSNLIPHACHDSADRFACLINITNTSVEDVLSYLTNKIEAYPLPSKIICNYGVYLINDPYELGDNMLEKAIIAQFPIKNSYAGTMKYYDSKMHDELLTEQEITNSMNYALNNHQFVLYYQPQFSRSTGMIIGTEALIRWKHPKKGLIAPNVFIPIFEKNGFITKVDLFVFEEACKFLVNSIKNNYTIVPISINFSKHDIYSPTFVEDLEAIRTKYSIPAKLLHVEITESLLYENMQVTKEIINKLHQAGYIVEMDDFGTGYSSLNVLKDLEFDFIKLDMLFLASSEQNSNRAGTILYSVVNMAKWLNMRVIAEGVETNEQADFLKSIGCDYIQGYLYSKPLPEEKYIELINASSIGEVIKPSDLIDNLRFSNFWDPKSQETLIFNNFVGGASIICYHKNLNTIELVRVNNKYIQELGMNLSQYELIQNKSDFFLSDKDRLTYFSMLDRAIESGLEEESETWCNIKSSCCGEEIFCIRSNVRLIGKMGQQYLFYEMIRNITSERRVYEGLLETEKRFKMAAEQVNVYFWEYTIATKEMRPCFRCMRDLGLPALLRNYPDSAIEAGIFPPEVADMYRDWHVQIEKGVKELEAIIPLTLDRVPFRVRYTTEFDENGNPVKAYGSAALIVE